jgi:hypothetical protein
MNRALLIAVVATLPWGCGNGAAPRTPEAARTASADTPTGTADPEKSADGRRNAPPADRSVPAASALPPDQVVSVSGCLTGGETIASPAPGGSATSAATGAGSADTGAGANLFVLRHAKPDAGSAGVGANGAGASGGPLLSGIAEYRLDGNPTELRSHLNQQVRISARLDPRQTMTDGARPGGTSGGATTDTGNPGGNMQRPAGSRSGQDGDPSAPTARSVTRLLLVESVQTVTPSCTAE